MKSPTMICKECGNNEGFTVGAKEYHTWLVDNRGDFVEDLGCDETECFHEYVCAECGSMEIGEKIGHKLKPV